MSKPPSGTDSDAAQRARPAQAGAGKSARIIAAIRIRHIITLASLAALAVLSYLTLDALIAANKGGASLVNVSGRQRMLSQRISMLSEQLATSSERSEVETELRQTIEAMESAHRMLVEGDPQIGGKGELSEALRELYFGPASRVDIRVRNYLDHALKLLEVGGELHVNHPILVGMRRDRELLLGHLDAVVRQYQLESDLVVTQLRRRAQIYALLALVLLGASAVLVFQPLARRAEVEMRKLEEARSVLRGILDSELEAIVMVDDRRRVVEANAAARDVLGVRVGNLFTNLDDTDDPDTQGDRPVDELARLFDRTEQPLDRWIEVTSRRSDGSTFPAEVSFTTVALARRNMVTICLRDITDRRRAEQQQRLAATVFSTVSQAIMVTDTEPRIVSVNPAFSAVTGYAADEVIGKNPSLLRSGRHDGAFFQSFWESLNQTGTWEGEIWNRRKNGEIFPEWLSISSVTDSQGRVSHFVAVFKDITDQKLAEDALRMAKEAAESATRAKSEFLAKMSHEIRTPLSAVLGFVQLMRRETGRSPGDLEKLETVARSGEHLQNLINDVLSISKIESGKMTLVARSFSLQSLLKSLTHVFDEAARQKNILFRSDVPLSVPDFVYGDDGRLRQVLLNLLDNAIKFTSKGHVGLLVSWKDDLASFLVSDTGEGMDDDEISELFSLYVQTESGVKSHEGTGLGLAISRSIVELMGGELAVESRKGEGSTFSFSVRLPAAEGEVQDEAGRVVAAKGANSLRILVVDDMIENRMLLSEILKPVGFDVREATDGHEALRVWSDWRPHLIWMDIRMPGLDGYECTRQIRRRETEENGDRTVIVAITASAFERDRAAILDAGCDDFVPKPYRESTIFETMKRYLDLQFVKETRRDDAAVESSLLGDSVARLPTDVIESLNHAIEAGDAIASQEIVDAIGGYVATGLGQMIREFRFDELQLLLGDRKASSDTLDDVDTPRNDASRRETFENGIKADILVVDDNPTNLNLLSGILAEHGHKVRVATSGPRALTAARLVRPDLVMLDITMPEMDGYEVCARLRQFPETQGVPIIFISALDAALDKVRAFELGGADYVSKPFQFEEVLARIDHQLQIARLQKRLRERNEELAGTNALLLQVSKDLHSANKELERLSTTDTLTGIPNRRMFHDRIEEEWERSRRDRCSLSLLMIDVDYFKLYNDTYGHQLGDDCLRKVAQAMQNELRSGGDFVARYGGEEFVVVLSGASPESSTVTAERLCAAVRDLSIPHEKSPAASDVTISVGASTLTPSSDGHWSNLVRGADEALYRAKCSGRNRVEA